MKQIILMIAVVVGQSVLATEKHQLEFTGNKAFTAQQLQQALAASSDYLFVAHPLAKDTEFPKNMQHLLRVAYADRGYVEARVTVNPPRANGKWRVRIEEGALFKCGKMIVPAKDNPLAKDLAAFLSQPIKGREAKVSGYMKEFSQENIYQPADWVAGQPARLTQGRLEALGWNARWFCFLKGYTRSKAILLPRPRENGIIDMEVQMILGKKQFGPGADKEVAVLGQIRVHGCIANKPEDVLSFLNLRPGMPIKPLMQGELKQALWNSGRFLNQEISWRKGNGKKPVEMDIYITECPNVPPLREPLLKNTKTALVIHRALMNTRRDTGQWQMDLTIDAAKAKPETRRRWRTLLGGDRTRFRAVFADGDMGIAVRNLTEKGPAALRFGFLFVAGKASGIYLPGSKVKLVAPDLGETHGAFINFSITPPGRPGEAGRFMLGGGVSSDRPGTVQFNINFPPAAILSALHNQDSFETLSKNLKTVSSKTTTLESGVKIHRFTLTHRQTGDPIQLEFRADAQPQLLSMRVETEWEGAIINLKLMRAKNALAPLIRAIEEDTKLHPNQYQAGRGKSSVMGFFVTHLGPAIAKWDNVYNNEESGLLDRAAFEAKMALIKAIGPRLQKALEPLNELITQLPGPFEIRPGIFQDHLAAAKVAVDGRTELIPLGNDSWSYFSPYAGEEFGFQMREAFKSPFSEIHIAMAWLCAVLNSEFNTELWPEIITRELKLSKIYSTKHTEAALIKMVESDKSGPLACLMAAQLLNALDSPGGVRCARLGLERINEKGIRLDYQHLASASSPIIRAADRFLGQTNPLLIRQMVDGIPQEFLDQNQKNALLKKLASEEKIKSIEIIEPIIAQFWFGMRNGMAGELQFAQFGSLRRIRAQAAAGDANHQFALGLMYFQGRGVTVDVVEAYALSTRAARKGHPTAAQLRTAIIEKMTPEQFSEGIKRASEKK
jgi:hypothetical protein